MTALDLVGFAAAGSNLVVSVPQLITALRSDREALRGISRATWAIGVVNGLVWAAWALLSGHLAAGAPTLVSIPSALVILWRTRG